MIKDVNYEQSLPKEVNIKFIFVLTIFLFVKIVSYFVFPDHIRSVCNVIQKLPTPDSTDIALC